MVIPPLSTAAEQMYSLLLNEKSSKMMFGETGQDPWGTQNPSPNSCLDLYFSLLSGKSSACHMFKMILNQRFK